jgi:CubicO group peptidase (beta-lactamase class C family)
MTDFEVRFARCIKLFSDARDKDGSKLSMFAFAADANGERANHLFQNVDSHTDLRSVSKVLVGLVLGFLLEHQAKVGNNALALETKVEPLLRRHMSNTARYQWADVRVVDLLNNTIGHDEGFLFRKDLGDLPESEYLDYVFDAPLPHRPGTHFSYSNVGPFVFSVIVQDWLGKSIHEIARVAVLEPLEIESEWRSFGEYIAGCTGLSMKNVDLIKLATLLRNGGTFGGVTVVPRSWVDKMCSPISLTPHMFDSDRVFPKYAYGLGLWVCQNGSYFCDGTNGQYLIVIPERSVAISTAGDQPDMKPITRCMIPIVTD